MRKSRGSLVWMLLPVLAAGGPVTGVGCSEAVGVIQNTGTSNAGRIPASSTCDDPRLTKGRDDFRHSTFGDETFFSNTLGLHRTIATLGIDRLISLGIKIDTASLPIEIAGKLKANILDPKDPATTLLLLRNDAVVGMTASFDPKGELASIGVTCALCHSTVDESFAKGAGARLDGWANRDLDVGALFALAPQLGSIASLVQMEESELRAHLSSFGPGKWDPLLFLDGTKGAPILIPPVFGLAAMGSGGHSGFGSVAWQESFCAAIQLRAHVTFFDRRLDDASKFPAAARARFGHLRGDVSLAALDLYVRSLDPPRPTSDTFDQEAAARGRAAFEGHAECGMCHAPPSYFEFGQALHAPSEVGVAETRTLGDRIRTAPLRGVWSHAKGGYYHDGRFSTISDLVDHYDTQMSLGLTAIEKSDLVQYVRSL